MNKRGPRIETSESGMHRFEPLADDLASLLAVERARPAAGDARRDRVRHRLGATLGIAALGSGGASSIGPGAGTAGSTAQVTPAATAVPQATAIGSATTATLKVAAVVATIVAAGGTAILGVQTLRDEPATATAMATVAASSAEPEPPSPLPPAEISVAGDAPGAAVAPGASASVRPAPAAPSVSAATPPGRDLDLAAERELLDSARGAIARGQGGAAIALLERHARHIPRGRLGEEREALWVRALLASGRSDEARARATRFKNSFPKSLLLPSLEETFGDLP